MKHWLLNIFIFVSAFGLFVSPTFAAAQSLGKSSMELINNVTIDFDVASIKGNKTYSVSPSTDTLYYDKNKTYAENSSESQILDNSANTTAPYKLNFELNEAALNQIAGISSYDQLSINVNVEGGCDIYGRWTTPIALKNGSGYTSNFIQALSLSGCENVLLRPYGDTKLGYKVYLKLGLLKGGERSESQGDKVMQFKFLPKTRTDLCQINFTGLSTDCGQIDPATGQRKCLDGANVDSNVTVSITDVDSGGYGSMLFQDGVNISETCNTYEGGEYCTQNMTEPSYTQNIGQLAAKSSGYVFEVRSQESGNPVLCTRTLPVTEKGGALIEPGDNQATTSGSVTLTLATTLPLCHSIPENADCGSGGSCRSKCQACEDQQGVWTGIGCMPTDFAGLISSLFTTFAGILGALIFFCVASNGLKIMVSGGNAEAVKKAQQALTACIVGFVVLTMSVLFLKIVGVNILKLPGWS